MGDGRAEASPGTKAFARRSVEATAYSSDWRSCGWEWGIALGPLPVYIPLCAGKRPSGSVAWPLIPRRRRERGAPHKQDLVLGALCFGAACAAGSVARAAFCGELAAGSAKALRLDRLFTSRRLREGALASATVGALAGGTVFPIGRYWAETDLVGLRYAGTTATGAFPRQARPAITRHNPLADPLGFLKRLVTLRWAPVLGTVAADTDCYPLKSRLRVDGYGWGVVEDRGGAIKGDDRIDVYFDSRKDALRFGRKRVDVHVEHA